MKTFITIAVAMMVSCAAVAGNKNAAAKAVASNVKKSSVVYVYTTKDGKQHGVWYHTDGNCALRTREYINGEKAGLSAMHEKRVQNMHMMACPTCGHEHEETKSVASK